MFYLLIPFCAVLLIMRLESHVRLGDYIAPVDSGIVSIATFVLVFLSGVVYGAFIPAGRYIK